jgi:phosphosulfolactate phosphohydrolase-like enzyme
MSIFVRNSYEQPAANGLADVAIFCDVFRASTTLLTILNKSPGQVLLTNDEPTANRYVAQGAVLFSEVFAGGFDNSPSQAENADLDGKVVIHKSTNLTNAIFSSSILRPGSGGRGFIGGIVNLNALVRYLQPLNGSGGKVFEIVAASHFGKHTEAVEDIACATMIADALRGHPHSTIPRLEEIGAKIERKRARGNYSRHYFDDVVIALQLNRYDFLAEIKVIDGNLMEITRID